MEKVPKMDLSRYGSSKSRKSLKESDGLSKNSYHTSSFSKFSTFQNQGYYGNKNHGSNNYYHMALNHLKQSKTKNSSAANFYSQNSQSSKLCKKSINSQSQSNGFNDTFAPNQNLSFTHNEPLTFRNCQQNISMPQPQIKINQPNYQVSPNHHNVMPQHQQPMMCRPQSSIVLQTNQNNPPQHQMQHSYNMNMTQTDILKTSKNFSISKENEQDSNKNILKGKNFDKQFQSTYSILGHQKSQPNFHRYDQLKQNDFIKEPFQQIDSQILNTRQYSQTKKNMRVFQDSTILLQIRQHEKNLPKFDDLKQQDLIKESSQKSKLIQELIEIKNQNLEERSKLINDLDLILKKFDTSEKKDRGIGVTLTKSRKKNMFESCKI